MTQRVIFFAQWLPVLLFHILGQQPASTAWAFTTTTTTVSTTIPTTNSKTRTPTLVVLNAGGFEWEDPTDEKFDQGVDNPFKNTELLKSMKTDDDNDDDDGAAAKVIDPARLLGPRLRGSNLYLVGMMGSGKSSVGDTLARRKLID